MMLIENTIWLVILKLKDAYLCHVKELYYFWILISKNSIWSVLCSTTIRSIIIIIIIMPQGWNLLHTLSPLYEQNIKQNCEIKGFRFVLDRKGWKKQTSLKY